MQMVVRLPDFFGIGVTMYHRASLRVLPSWNLEIDTTVAVYAGSVQKQAARQWLFPCAALSGFNLVGVVREFAQNELLEHSVSYPCGGADSEVLEHQPHAAIRLGIVGVRNGRRGQNATHA